MMSQSAIDSASATALSIDRTAASRSITPPRSIPLESAVPRPSTVTTPSGLTSPTTATTFDVPISNPTSVRDSATFVILFDYYICYLL